MNELSRFKADYIEYLLFNYTFKSRITVWLLNYIKTQPELLSKIHFVKHVIKGHDTLEISTSGSHNLGIKLSSKHLSLKNSNEIFHQIVDAKKSVDIKVHFAQDQEQDSRQEDILVKQLLHSPQYSKYLSDIYSLQLSPYKEQLIIDFLKDNIDLSLRLNDRDLFYHFSHLLNTFKLRSLNSSTKG
ncbi:YpiB family protein [Staphylococcus sp. SQ8-PEA]|uniref:YpiB family protein n=1 Tax=Staphylococcus marylandisciuri TaxID=2981529 RepID=A0ABT2QND4_9STAP|nr:YpiB family protein [Staphylococcus marylandisciuri]MCU5745488.1 YpiB family protein [Staphylococcus marylandisciuri]